MSTKGNDTTTPGDSPEFLAALNDVQTFLGFKAPEADKS